MKKKHEDIVSENLLYAFLDFENSLTDPPNCFIVPSSEVAAAVKEAHALWLAPPGRQGQQRNDSKMRRFLPDYSKVRLDICRPQSWLNSYREAWHLAEALS